MEETFEVLLEEGALVRNGSIKLVKPLRELKIPPTVQDILTARIDRLPMQRKDLLQTLAVIGTEFRLDLVRRLVAHPEEELERMLAALQLAEFIYEQPASGDIEYIFKHALTHDVAYKSVLNERRRTLHERTGAALESIYAESLNDLVAELAYHYARCSNPGKAVAFCLRAVQQCMDRGSHAEAVAHFETALELLQKLPDDDRRAELELDLRNAAGLALTAIKGWASPEAEQSFARAMVLCQRPGIDWEKIWSALYGVFLLHVTRPDLRKGCAIGAELVALSEQHGATEYIANAASLLGFARLVSGDFELAGQSLDRGWALLESITKPGTELTRHRGGLTPLLWSQAFNRITAGRTLWFLGYPDRCLERINSATALANNSGSKAVLELVNNFAVLTYELRRELERMKERAETTLILSTELGDVNRRALSEIYLGWAQTLEGDPEQGIERMRHHLLELRTMGSEVLGDYGPALIATALGWLARYDEGLRTIDESFPFFERTGQRFYEPEVHRLKAELLLAQNASNASRAEQSFRTAIEISRRQKAKSWELRATTSLARLLAKQGKRDEARASLADIYNWFTEGFDTPDLQDAKALLDELGG